MNLSEDQKKMLRGVAIYVLLYPVCYPLFGWLFRGKADWSDFLVALCTCLFLGVLFSVFTIYGARIPEKPHNDKPKDQKE